jgi:HEPN domain-containing protein
MNRNGGSTWAGIYNFLASARLMLANRRPERAVFFLHQSVELLLRGFIIAVTGREVKTHVLGDLLRTAVWHAPQLHDLFPTEALPGKSLLAQLEKGYVCARYSEHFCIDIENAQCLYNAAAAMRKYVCGVYRDVLRDYTGKDYQDILIPSNMPQVV